MSFEDLIEDWKSAREGKGDDCPNCCPDGACTRGRE